MAAIQRISLAPNYDISRIIKGGWQLSGDHGSVDRIRAIQDMGDYFEAGITTFDCADIYTGVEEMIGEFRVDYTNKHGADSLDTLRIHTKFVPDLSLLATINRGDVERIIDRSLQRLKTNQLDLVQFHWWDYTVPRYVEVANWLLELQQAGKINKISGTNFDAQHAQELIDAGIPITSMQVQYSLLDRRTEKAVSALGITNDFKLLCYGTVAGGFLSDKWLGMPEPDHRIENRSLIKYKLIIDDFGGWDLFQTLLSALHTIGKKHQVSISTVASRWILDQDNVAAAIIGVRRADHLAEHMKVFGVTLDAEDFALIDSVLLESNPIEGDVYTVERDITGRHGGIMKYELNNVVA